MYIGDNIFATQTPSEIVDMYYTAWKLNPNGFTLPYLKSTFSSYKTDIAEYTFWAVRLKIITNSVKATKDVEELEYVDSSIDFIVEYLDDASHNFQTVYLPNRLSVRGWLYNVSNTLTEIIKKYDIKNEYTDYLLDK